jgi:phosphohistidine phosphatase
MRLYLIRHAAASPRAPGVPDATRPLTPRGRARFRRAVEGLRRLGVRFDALRHSPLRRAVETAELLAPLVDGGTFATPNLARAPGAALLAEIRGESVALVGHEPMLSSLAAWLVLGDKTAGAKFAVKKGAALVLDGAPRPGAMQLAASLPPKALRRIAGR